MHFKRKRPKQQVRCTLCTPHRWCGNSRARFGDRYEAEKKLADEEINRGTAHPNRNKVRASKLGKFWCGGCDAYLVYEGQRCPRCGHVNGRKRMKREVA